MSPSAVPPPPPPPPQDFTASNLSVSSSSPRHRGNSNSNSNNYLSSPPISIWSPSASTRCSRDDFINSSYDDDAELQRVFSFDEWLEDNKENSSTFCPSRKFFSFDECVDSGNLFDDDYDDCDYYDHHEREDSHSRGVTTTIGQSDENENDATTPDGFGSISDVGIAQSSSSMKIDKSLLVSLNTYDDLSSTSASDDSPLVIYNCSSIPRASDLTADDKTANETADRPTNSKPPPIKTIQLYLQENDFNRYRDQIDKDIDALSTTAGSTIEDNVLSPTSTKDVSTLTTSSTTESGGIPREIVVTIKSPINYCHQKVHQNEEKEEDYNGEDHHLRQTPSKDRLLVESTVLERYQRLVLSSSFRYDQLA